MTFTIYQLDADGNEKIIGSIRTEETFLFYIKKYLPDLQVNYQLLYDVTVTDLISNDKYGEGFYLLCSAKAAGFVEKTKVLNAGYIYNSTGYAFKILRTWKMIEYEKFFDDWLIKVDIKKFVVSRFEPAPSFLINSKQNDGKINLVRNILIDLKAHDDFTAPVKTEPGSQTWVCFTKNTLIICSRDNYDFYKNNFQEAKIICDLNEEIINDFSNRKHACIVFDDCINDYYTLSSLTSKLQIPYIVTTTNPFWATYNVAHKINYIFLMQETSHSERCELWFTYRHVFPHQITFEHFFDWYTKQSYAMVIKNTIDSVIIDEKICYY